MAKLRFGVGSFDPVALAAAGVVLLGISMLAIYLPARRPRAWDPIIALHHD
jgi:hypothetical protein